MSSAEDDSAQLSGGGSHHEKLMHHAIDIFCSRPLRNLDAAPRAGEVVALQAYERIVRKALAANESDVQLLARLKAAGVVAEQAAAAAGAYKSRLSEMLAHLDEETAKISGPYLADVDWKVNLSLASSTASSLRKPSVQLALYLDEEGAARKEVVMELERAQLDMMIESVSALLEATDRIPIPQAL